VENGVFGALSPMSAVMQEKMNFKTENVRRSALPWAISPPT
jgi:hypothetical protein